MKDAQGRVVTTQWVQQARESGQHNAAMPTFHFQSLDKFLCALPDD